MIKANKARFLVLLCIAVVFIAATLTLLFIPEKKPFKITEEVSITKTDGVYEFHGKLKNVTNDEIVLTNTNFYLEVKVINANGANHVYTIRNFQNVAIQPNEELDLSEIEPHLGNVQSAEIVKIIYTPDKVQNAIYGGSIVNGKLAVFALLTGIIGVLFLATAVVSYVTNVRNTKRANYIISQMRQTFENSVYVEGYFVNKRKNRTATAKTAASVLGAVLSLLFTGSGRYKVYYKRAKYEFIITETSIYTYTNGKFQNVTNELQAAFINPAVTDKNKVINVNDEDKNVYFTVRIKGADKAQTLSNLKNIFENTTQPENIQGQNYGETD